MLCPIFNYSNELNRQMTTSPSFIQLSIDVCKNDKKCLNANEIKEILTVSRSALKVFYKDISADFITELPFNSFINHVSIPFNLNTQKDAEISFVEVNAFMDNGYVIKDISKIYI